MTTGTDGPMERDRLQEENERLRGTLRYIAAQAQQNYAGVLSVILCNAKAALNDDHQAMVAKAKEYLKGRATNERN